MAHEKFAPAPIPHPTMIQILRKKFPGARVAGRKLELKNNCGQTFRRNNSAVAGDLFLLVFSSPHVSKRSALLLKFHFDPLDLHLLFHDSDVHPSFSGEAGVAR
jgi:hypothetical protein